MRWWFIFIAIIQVLSVIVPSPDGHKLWIFSAIAFWLTVIWFGIKRRNAITIGDITFMMAGFFIYFFGAKFIVSQICNLT